MVRQKIIEALPYGARVRSNRGNTYTAIFKSKVMSVPADAIDAEIEFDGKTPVISRFYYPVVEKEESIEEQAEAFKQLGGDY